MNNLSKFRDENIRIYIPLSYGVDRDYANSVKEYANKLFGNKAICIFREMNPENYIRFLWSIDVAYFLLERQAALGNLMRLIYMGKRIYLPSNTVMYDFFRSQDIDIADANTVIQKTFDEFIKPINNTTPPQYILDRTNPNKVVEKWRYIFNTLSNDTKNTKGIVKMPKSKEFDLQTPCYIIYPEILEKILKLFNMRLHPLGVAMYQLHTQLKLII